MSNDYYNGLGSGLGSSFNTKHYQTFDKMRSNFTSDMSNMHSDFDSRNSGIFCCGKACFIIFVLIYATICFTFDAFAITYANEYANATCYQHAKIMTLSNYVLLSSACSIAIVSILVIGLCTFIMCFSSENLKSLLSLGPVVLALIVYSLFSVVMAIIGAIELSTSYPVCNEEAYIVSVFTIVIVVLRFMGCLSCCLKCEVTCG